MLKYVSKIAMDILPSVVATIIGAYIVNHYITAKPAADAPRRRGVVGRARKRSTSKADAKPAETILRRRQHLPKPGVRAKGISEKAMSEKAPTRRPPKRPPPRSRCRKVSRRRPPTSRRKPRASPAETPASPPCAARKDGRQDGTGCRRRLPCRQSPPRTSPRQIPRPPVEAAVAAGERRDANDLARAAIERLRGASDGSPRRRKPRASRIRPAVPGVEPARGRQRRPAASAADHGLHARR